MSAQARPLIHWVTLRPSSAESASDTFSQTTVIDRTALGSKKDWLEKLARIACALTRKVTASAMWTSHDYS